MNRTRVIRRVAGALILATIARAPGDSLAEAATSKGGNPTNAIAAAPLRDPFVPVGYVPPAPLTDLEQLQALPATSVRSAQPLVAAPPRIIWPELKINGIGRLGTHEVFSAFIEGVGPVQTGATFSKTVSGITYTWKVERISTEGVSLTRLKAEAATRRARP